MDVTPSASTCDARSLAVASWDTTPEEKTKTQRRSKQAGEGR